MKVDGESIWKLMENQLDFDDCCGPSEFTVNERPSDGVGVVSNFGPRILANDFAMLKQTTLRLKAPLHASPSVNAGMIRTRRIEKLRSTVSWPS